MQGRQNYSLNPQENGNLGNRKNLLGEAMPARGQGGVASAYDPKRQQMAGATAITCWSPVCKVGPISLLSTAECGTGANRSYGSGHPCRRFTGKSAHERTCVILLKEVVCKYSL